MNNGRIEIIPVRGHYEVYLDGEFWFSADSISEVAQELEEVKYV